MRYARRLRHQLDEWQQVWRQVEAMVDRLETAREEDDVPRAKTESLLVAAGVLERRRLAAGAGSTPLGDPVVHRLPTTGWDPDTGQVVAVDAWDPVVRLGRLPGTDELELAVADLETVAFPLPLADVSGPLVLDQVRLFPSRPIFEVELDGVKQMLRVPSYPGGDTPLQAAGSVVLEDVPSLFPLADRHAAATFVGDGEEEPPAFVGTWTALTLARRVRLPGEPDPPPYTTDVVGTGSAPLTSALLDQAQALVADVLVGFPAQLPGTHGAVAAELASAARGAAGTPATDAEALRTTADLLDAEGLDAPDEGLVEALETAADSLSASPEALLAVADAAEALAAALVGAPLGLPAPGPVVANRVARATALGAALAALPAPGSLSGLLALPVELGALGREIDAVVAGRLAYPDGSLRILRTLELAFARWWPGLLRWMRLRSRPGGALDRGLDAFLQPFVDGLSALVTGTDGGFAVDGLELAVPVSSGAALLPVDAPASLLPVLTRAVEAGQVATLPGTRPAAAFVLGLGRDGDRLAVLTAPLRVSLASPADGVPGLVDAGTTLSGSAPALTTADLRRGLATDPARDGTVEQAVALHGQLALLLGRTRLDARLGAVRVPDPAGPALHSIVWHGEVGASTSAFVLLGAPEAWWDRTGETPVPTLVRPGELLLLRGDLPPDDEASAGVPGTVQTVLEVDRAVWVPGSMLDRLDLGHAALLATDPSALQDVGGPALLCGPQDDLVLLTARRTWQAAPLTGPVTLRRDFAGFDLPSLAVGTPLGDDLVAQVTGTSPGGPDVDRELELAAATGLLDDWTRYAR